MTRKAGGGLHPLAVLRGVKGGRVYLADPARGNIRMPLYAFVETWRQADGRGIIFVVEPNAGAPVAASPLALTATRPSQPEIMTVREKVAVGGPCRCFMISRGRFHEAAAEDFLNLAAGGGLNIRAWRIPGVSACRGN